MTEKFKKNIRNPIRGRVLPIAVTGILISLPLAVLTGYAVASDYMLQTRKKSSQVDESQSDVPKSKKLLQKSFQNAEDSKKD